MCDELEVSENRACRVLNQPRSTQRYESRLADDEPLLVKRIIEFATEYGRYGYRRVTGDAQERRLAGEPQAGGADLAAGRTEGAEAAAETGEVMAE